MPAGVVTYDPDDMTVMALAGTSVAELTAVVGEARQEVALDPPRHACDRRWCAGRRAIGDPPVAARPGARDGARGARRRRFGNAREGRRAGREERDRLRHSPAVRRLVGHARGDRAGDAALPAACRARRVVSRGGRRPRRSARLAVPAVGSVARRAHGARTARRPRRRPHRAVDRGAARRRHRASVAPAARRPTSRPHQRVDWRDGGPRPHAGRARARGPVVPRRSVWAPCTSRATTQPTSCAHATRRLRTADGCSAKPAAPGVDGFGVAVPNAALAARVKAAFDPHNRFAPGRLPL